MAVKPYRKIAIAACFGTFVEWYDFLTFASLATYFANLFFPSEDPVAGLLYSLATFGMGMVVRPIGAILFGSFGDRYGRRAVFVVTIAVMGVATFSIGLLPTHAQWGWFATALLLILRLIQGLAMGGEIGGANVYLAEHAPAEKRGAATSVLQWMGGLGILASTFQIVVLQSLLSEGDFMRWGWRIPFLLSGLLLLATFKARLALHESPVFEQLRRSRHTSSTPLRDCLRDPKVVGRMALLFFSVSAGGGLLFFCSQVYAPVYLRTVVKLDPIMAGWLTLVTTFALFPLTYWGGALSDRFGRRPIVLGGLLIGAVSIFPVYAGLQAFAAQPWILFALLLIPVIAVAMVTGPQTAMLSELFPAQTRYTAVGLPHNLAAGWIGGLAPYMVTLIADKSGHALLGVGYPFVLLVLAFCVGYRYLPETRGLDLNA
ncbi:MAG TPA: MFS transporter [Rhodocyclaceae bacterium]|nr:MFS transporter [Rhodocyclaceae bacterium]